MQQQLNSLASCSLQIATNTQAAISAIRKNVLIVTKDQMGITTQLALAWKTAKDYQDSGVTLLNQSMQQIQQFLSGGAQNLRRQLIDQAKLNMIRSMGLPQAISTAIKLFLLSRINVVSGEYSQGERLQHQLVVEDQGLKKRIISKLCQILQPAKTHIIELILSLKEASSFVELISTKGCLQAQKAVREELIQIKEADQQQEQTIKVKKMKYEQKRQAREATKNDFKHDAKQLMTTLDVFEDQDDFIYQNIRNLFMTPEQSTEPQTFGNLGKQSPRTAIRNEITNLTVNKDKLLMAMEDGEVDEVREAISNSRAGIASLEHQLNSTIGGLESICARAEQQFLQANEQYSNTSEQARKQEADKYPNVVADSEVSAKVSLASLKDYIPKKIRNIERQEAIVELSNKREVASGKMRMLMQIKQKVCDIKTSYEFIGKDLQSFMASDLQNFMTSKTSCNKVQDYGKELQDIKKMAHQEQCVAIEINSKSKPVKVFDAINDVAKGIQDKVRCQLSVWKYELLNHLQTQMALHTQIEKQRADHVRELNLIIGNQKNGSKIKEAFIMANKCQVYNDCITMISHKRIELLDQVCIKVYDGENLVKHIRNAEL